jgi:hypothetical protein
MTGRDKLAFNRAQLQEVFKDFKSIKEFERLIGLVDSLIPSTVVDLELAAEAADAKATEALELLERITEAIEALASAPARRHDNSIVTDYIDFPEEGPHVTLQRRVQWNKDDGTLDVGLYNNVVLQCGQELHIYTKNVSGAVIPNGSVVMYAGSVGASGKLEVELAVADGSLPADYMLALATQDINIGEFGYVTVFGLVRGFNTTGATKTIPEVWADGDVLYIDAAFTGELTKTLPVAPNLKLPIAVVLKAGVMGSVYVRFKTGESISSLHDVYQPSIRDLELLQYNNTLKRWETGALPWVDVDFPIIVRTTGPNIPALVAINGNITMPQWAVNNFNVCESQEFIHSWKEGSTVYWHLHLTTNGLDATNRFVRFTVEYGYVDVNGQWIFPAVLDSGDLLIPANTPDKTMIIMSLGNFTPAIHIGGHSVARLTRIASVGAAPTLNPWIPMLQQHLQLDTLGSRFIGSK